MVTYTGPGGGRSQRRRFRYSDRILAQRHWVKTVEVGEEETVLPAFPGIIGPILFTVVWVFLGSIQPGYDHIAQTISELGAVGAPNALIMNAVGFVPSGLLIVAFALGLHRGISGEKRSKMGPALLALVGAGIAGAGIFPVNLADLQSFTSIMHVLVSSLVFFAGGWLAPLVIARRLKEDVRWQGYRRYSLATGALMLGFFGLSLVFLAVLPGVLEPILGLMQRLNLGVLFLWIFVMADRLFLLSFRPGAEAAPAG